MLMSCQGGLVDIDNTKLPSFTCTELKSIILTAREGKQAILFQNQNTIEQVDTNLRFDE